MLQICENSFGLRTSSMSSKHEIASESDFTEIVYKKVTKL